MRAPLYSDREDELFARETIEDPHPLFARLRAERPISRVGDSGVHLVTKWDLIEEALGREADFSAHFTGVLIRGDDGRPAIFGFPEQEMSQVIATADEPEHAVHRALTQPRLAASRIAALEEPLREWTRLAVEPWVAAGGGDFVPISERIPAQAVAAVLGLPADDVSRHRQWAMTGGDMLAGDLDLERILALSAEARRMVEYLRRHLDAAAAHLRSGPEAPLLHALAGGVRDGRIDVEHATGIAMVMFGAGGESTAALIGSVVRRLATDPESAAVLRRDPSLVPRFVEEVARLEPPFKFHYRLVRRPCTLGGVDLEPGDRLMLCWASANRDAAHFDEPDRLRLDRRHPKHHMTFGRGTHFCIGAPLARLEARVVCESVLASGARLRLRADDPPRWAHSIFVRRHERLPIEVGAA